MRGNVLFLAAVQQFGKYIKGIKKFTIFVKIISNQAIFVKILNIKVVIKRLFISLRTKRIQASMGEMADSRAEIENVGVSLEHIEPKSKDAQGLPEGYQKTLKSSWMGVH